MLHFIIAALPCTLSALYLINETDSLVVSGDSLVDSTKYRKIQPIYSRIRLSARFMLSRLPAYLYGR